MDPEIGLLRAVETEENGEKQLYIEGYLSVEYDPENGQPVIDDHGTNIAATSAEPAIRKAMDDFMKVGSIIYSHGTRGLLQIGKPIEYRLDQYGIWLKARISKPVTPERIQVYNDILDGSLKGYSIRFGSGSIVKSRVIGGKKVPYIIPDRIVEATVTAVPSNPKTTFTAYLRMIPDEAEETQNTRSIKKMDPEKIGVTLSQYEEFITSRAMTNILQSKLEESGQQLRDVQTKLTDTEKKLVDMVDPETVRSLQEKVAQAEKEKAELNTRMADLQKKYEDEMNRSDITLKKTFSAIERTTQIHCDAALDRAVTELEAKPYHELVASFIIDEQKERGKKADKEGIVFNRQIVFLNELKKKNIEFKPEEFHLRTITTSTGIMKNSEIEYSPIVMDSMPSPLWRVLPKESIDTTGFDWYQRTAKSTASYDSESATPTASDSTYGLKQGTVKFEYAGGKVSDPAKLFSPEGAKALSLEIKSCQQAMREKAEWVVIHGNASITDSAAATNTYHFDGLMKQVAENKLQNYDNLSSTATLDVLDDLSDRFMDRVEVADENGKMMSYIACDQRSFTKFRKLFRALHYGYNTVEIVIGGLRYQALHWNGAYLLRCENIVDFVTAAPTFSLAAGSYGGNVTDATWRVTVAAVTKNGETVQATEATQATSSQGLRVTITSAAAHTKYRIYAKADGAANSTTLVKEILNVTTAGSTFNVDFIADPTDLYLTPVRSTSYGRCIAFKVGGDDGVVVKEAANMEYVEKGRVGNYLEFYLRSYHTLIVKNEKAVVVMNIKHT